MVVYAVWDRVARVRFPASRQSKRTSDFMSEVLLVFARESKSFCGISGGTNRNIQKVY